MADSEKQDPTEENEASVDLGTSDETIFNSDIGDDWGEAFQAEDFEFSPDKSGEEEFFLDDDSFEDEVEDDDFSELADDELSIGQGPSLKLPIIDKLLSLVGVLLALPLKQRVPALCLPILLIFAAVFFMHDSPDRTEQEVTEQEAPLDETNQEGETPVGAGDETVAQQEKIAEQDHIDEVAAIIEKVRKRWKLPSFFISSFNEEDNSTTLLSIDLTFVLLLEQEEIIPDHKEIMVRETIYQFFNNRPFEELKRFSLSRGEMTRSLTAWVAKQLPDIPLSSIVFDRYQIH